MPVIEKYSKIISGGKEKAIGLMYFDDLYKAQVFVDLEKNVFNITDMVNFPSTNYSSFDEITNSAVQASGVNSNVSAISITKDEFDKILKEHNLRSDFILKIKEKLPDEVIKNMLENN